MTATRPWEIHMRATSLSFAAVALIGLAACAAADAGPAEDAASPQTIDAAAAVELLEQRDDLVLIDVRTPEEFADGHLAGAEMIDIQAGDFADRIAELDPDATTVVYCRTGNRSASAVAIMAEQGFTDLYDAGGFADLAEAGAPVGG